jgi:hypothetical protein
MAVGAADQGGVQIESLGGASRLKAMPANQIRDPSITETASLSK